MLSKKLSLIVGLRAQVFKLLLSKPLEKLSQEKIAYCFQSREGKTRVNGD